MTETDAAVDQVADQFDPIINDLLKEGYDISQVEQGIIEAAERYDIELEPSEVVEVEPLPRRCTDKQALDRMAYLFSAMEWPGASGLEDLAEIVARTGREIKDDPNAEWGRH